MKIIHYVIIGIVLYALLYDEPEENRKRNDWVDNLILYGVPFDDPNPGCAILLYVLLFFIILSYFV